MQVSPSSRRVALPLGLQLLAILVGSLIVAQIVTLGLTVAIPPAPTQSWNLDEVADALRGGTGNDRLELRRMPGPPDISGAGWLVSASSRQALADKLDRPIGDVVLAFYTQLPVGGVAVPVRGGSTALEPAVESGPLTWLVTPAQAQNMPGGPPPGGMPGGGFPGGGFPGGRPGGGIPGGGIPGGAGGIPGSRPGAGLPQRTPGPVISMPRPSNPSSVGGRPGGVGAPGGDPRSPMNPPGAVAMPPSIPQVTIPIALPQPMVRPVPEPSPTADPAPSPSPTVATRAAELAVPPAPALEPSANTPAPQPIATPTATAPVRETAQPIPFRQPQGVLSLTSPPFIEGDFIAALRQGDGSWVAVAPKAEPFPNRWQRRVMLWFVLSLLIVAPLAWLFARRIVVPLQRFAQTAEALGRDPAASVVPLSGPAEIGRAAHAFNVMQTRLRAFVDDRTAMIGAISHDLRTPLTRLRFRLENVPDDQREALLREVEEMEQMIGQVIGFIRDASTPGARERIDFAALVESSVADAKVLGGKVELEAVEHGQVEVDPVGMRRLLNNLLENALKYGETARVRVLLGDTQAVAEIIDDGPGIPAEEHDQAFDPFYRGVEARSSGKPGSGLGLAVCRSIARAHGGDVHLEQRSDGFVARVAVPLSFGDRLPRAA